jgi:streptogramin lyase
LKDKSIKRKTGNLLVYDSANNVAGAANDIDVAADGSVYSISNTMTSTGYTLHKLDHTDSWVELPNTPANVKSIAIDDVGMAWVTTLNGKIFNHEGKSDWIE